MLKTVFNTEMQCFVGWYRLLFLFQNTSNQER